MRLTLATLATAFVFAGPALAEMTMLGVLHIEAPMLRATPPNAPVAGGFVTIVNTGETDDTLVAAAIAGDVATEVQLHNMTMAEGVMKMDRVDGGIVIPAGETVTLAPGGLHLMVMGLTEQMVEGESHEITLTFAQAGDVTLTAPVLSLGEIRATMDAATDVDHSAHHGMMVDGDHGDMHDKHHGN